MGTIQVTEDAQIHILDPKPTIKIESNKHYRTTKDCYQYLPQDKKKLLARENEVVTCMYVISEELGWERSMFRTELGTSVLWHSQLTNF